MKKAALKAEKKGSMAKPMVAKTVGKKVASMEWMKVVLSEV